MKKIFTILILILFLSAFFPAKSFAADIFYGSSKNTYELNEKFSVQVFIDTKDANINTVGGTILFPSDLLKLEEIRAGNSTLNFWVEGPHQVSDGKIVFSGVTPGGFSGPKIFLFSAVFSSKSEGNGSLYFDDIQVLQNDGSGTQIESAGTPFPFSVNKVPNGTQIEDLSQTDTEPPESFTPLVAKDPSIFDGKYFLIFNTVDKGVGIDHYEVREGILSDYILAESPYLLEDQTLSKDIIVRAVDKAGNKRSEIIKAENKNSNFQKIIIIVIILLICFYLAKRRSSKISRK